jgi:A/G-specific adenine glycosylase
MSFSSTITSWYLRHKRDLPWRNTSNPYFIWLSEVILQQTRVNQGLSYYYRFTESYPTVHHLANAPEDEVMKLWQGLGYYSRARNMHASAKEIVSRGGQFPGSYAELIRLKGIGAYTASAIASFAYNEPVAVLDGNVYRVLSRFLGIGEPIDSTSGKKLFARTAEELLDRTQPALHNQAIMEFGALQCKPVSPDCSVCPLRGACVAAGSGTVDQLPVKARKAPVRPRYFNYLVIQDDGSVLLNKRSGKDIWANLYDFPLIESPGFLSREELVSSSEFQKLFNTGEYEVRRVSGDYVHQLSHQRLHARFWEISPKPGYAPLQSGFLKVEEERISQYAVPRLIEKYLDESGKCPR